MGLSPGSHHDIAETLLTWHSNESIQILVQTQSLASPRSLPSVVDHGFEPWFSP